MEFSFKFDNQVESMICDYMKTIFELQNRSANSAAENLALRQQIEALTKERDALKPKEPVKLEAVQSEAPAAG